MTKEEIKAAARIYKQNAEELQLHRYSNEFTWAEDDFTAGAEWAAGEMEKDKWISVEDRLPEYGEEANVLTKDGRVTSLARFKRYEEAETYYWDNNYGQGNVHLPEAITHWQPLPPKTEQP